MLIDPVYSFHCINLRIPDTIPLEATPWNALSRAALFRAKLCESSDTPIERIKQAMIGKHMALLAETAGQGRKWSIHTRSHRSSTNEARDLFSETVPSMLPQSTKSRASLVEMRWDCV